MKKFLSLTLTALCLSGVGGATQPTRQNKEDLWITKLEQTKQQLMACAIDTLDCPVYVRTPRFGRFCLEESSGLYPIQSIQHSDVMDNDISLPLTTGSFAGFPVIEFGKGNTWFSIKSPALYTNTGNLIHEFSKGNTYYRITSPAKYTNTGTLIEMTT